MALAPLLLAPLGYGVVVADRTSGRLRFVLGLPRSRGSYLAGVLLSRAAVAVVAVVVSTLAGFAVALVAYPQAPDPGMYVSFLVLALPYVVSIVCLYVAISAVAPSRSAAMAGAGAAYFVLFPFWLGLAGPLSLGTVLTGIGDLLGIYIGEDTLEFVQALSPTGSFAESFVHILADTGLAEEYSVSPADEPEDQVWFTVLVCLGWAVGSTALGYLAFRRSELE